MAAPAKKKPSPSSSSRAFVERRLGTLTAEEKKKRMGMFFRGPVLAVIDATRAFEANDGRAAILDLETGGSEELPFKPGREWRYLKHCAVSADGTAAVVIEEKGWVTVIADLADAKKSRVRIRAHKEWAAQSAGVTGDTLFIHQSYSDGKKKDDGCVQLWSIASQKVVRTLPTKTHIAATISRQGSVALVGTDDREDPKGEVEIWNAPWGKPRVATLAKPKKGFIRVLQFSDDGSILACGLSPTGSDRCFEEVVLVDVANGKVLGRATTRPGKGIQEKSELRRKMTPETWIHPLSSSEFVIVDLGRAADGVEEFAFERWSVGKKSPTAREIITLQAKKHQLGIASQIAFGAGLVMLNREQIVAIA